MSGSDVLGLCCCYMTGNLLWWNLWSSLIILLPASIFDISISVVCSMSYSTCALYYGHFTVVSIEGSCSDKWQKPLPLSEHNLWLFSLDSEDIFFFLWATITFEYLSKPQTHHVWNPSVLNSTTILDFYLAVKVKIPQLWLSWQLTECNMCARNCFTKKKSSVCTWVWLCALIEM